MQEVGFINGEFVSVDAPCVRMEDRGFQFGDGIYEVTHFYDGKLFALDRHMARLFRSLKEIAIEPPYTEAEFVSFHEELIKRSGFKNGAIYLQITRGASPRQHFFPEGVAPTVTMNVREGSRNVKAQTEGVSAFFYEDIRWLRCDIKSLNLLGAVLAKQYTHEKGGGEAILYRKATNTVTEGSSSNFFIVKDGVLYTHPVDNFILKGVTRSVIVEKCVPAAGVKLVEKEFTPEEALAADEAFFTSTSAEITPIVTLEGKPVGKGVPGEVTKKLQKAFWAEVDKETK